MMPVFTFKLTRHSLGCHSKQRHPGLHSSPAWEEFLHGERYARVFSLFFFRKLKPWNTSGGTGEVGQRVILCDRFFLANHFARVT